MTGVQSVPPGERDRPNAVRPLLRPRPRGGLRAAREDLSPPSLSELCPERRALSSSSAAAIHALTLPPRVFVVGGGSEGLEGSERPTACSARARARCAAARSRATPVVRRAACAAIIAAESAARGDSTGDTTPVADVLCREESCEPVRRIVTRPVRPLMASAPLSFGSSSGSSFDAPSCAARDALDAMRFALRISTAAASTLAPVADPGGLALIRLVCRSACFSASARMSDASSAGRAPPLAQLSEFTEQFESRSPYEASSSPSVASDSENPSNRNVAPLGEGSGVSDGTSECKSRGSGGTCRSRARRPPSSGLSAAACACGRWREREGGAECE